MNTLPPATRSSNHDGKRFASPLGQFSPVSRLSATVPHEEWMVILPDQTEVVVSALEGAPHPVEVNKAVSVVQSRSYLGKRAVQLIARFMRMEGTWRLLTIDFGAEAKKWNCEFLMCFAFVRSPSLPPEANPYFEIAFSLPTHPQAETPIFELSLKTIVGLQMPFG